MSSLPQIVLINTTCDIEVLAALYFVSKSYNFLLNDQSVLEHYCKSFYLQPVPTFSYFIYRYSIRYFNVYSPRWRSAKWCLNAAFEKGNESLISRYLPKIGMNSRRLKTISVAGEYFDASWYSLDVWSFWIGYHQLGIQLPTRRLKQIESFGSFIAGLSEAHDFILHESHKFCSDTGAKFLDRIIQHLDKLNSHRLDQLMLSSLRLGDEKMIKLMTQKLSEMKDMVIHDEIAYVLWWLRIENLCPYLVPTPSPMHSETDYVIFRDLTYTLFRMDLLSLKNLLLIPSANLAPMFDKFYTYSGIAYLVDVIKVDVAEMTPYLLRSLHQIVYDHNHDPLDFAFILTVLACYNDDITLLPVLMELFDVSLDNILEAAQILGAKSIYIWCLHLDISKTPNAKCDIEFRRIFNDIQSKNQAPSTMCYII